MEKTTFRSVFAHNSVFNLHFMKVSTEAYLSSTIFATSARVWTRNTSFSSFQRSNWSLTHILHLFHLEDTSLLAKDTIFWQKRLKTIIIGIIVRITRIQIYSWPSIVNPSWACTLFRNNKQHVVLGKKRSNLFGSESIV
jgi:hypothetical protein